MAQSNVMKDGTRKVLFGTTSYDYKNYEYDRNNLILVTFDSRGLPVTMEKLLNLADKLETEVKAVGENLGTTEILKF